MEAASGRRGRWRPWVLAGLAVAGSAMLTVLAVPRIMAALQAQPALALVQQLDRFAQQQPDVVDLVVARRALLAAQRWQHDPLLATELARIELILATRQVQLGQDAKPLLEATIASARSALHGDPAQTRAWLVLSEALLLRDGVGAPALVDYFTQSLRASPHDLGLALNRAWMAILLWDRLDPATRKLGALQMQMVVRRWKLEMLVNISRQLGNPAPAREALSDDPALRARFESLYLRG